MIIEEKDFILTQLENFDNYDLELLYVINAKVPEKRREEFKSAGYGLTLSTSLNKIINYRLANKKDTYALKEYLEEYRKERRSLTDILKENEKTRSSI